MKQFELIIICNWALPLGYMNKISCLYLKHLVLDFKAVYHELVRKDKDCVIPYTIHIGSVTDIVKGTEVNVSSNLSLKQRD